MHVSKIINYHLTKVNKDIVLLFQGVPHFTTLPGPVTAYFWRGFSGLIAEAGFRSESAYYVPLLTLTRGQMATNMIGIPVERGRNIVNDGQNFCGADVVCANGGTCQSTGLLNSF